MMPWQQPEPERYKIYCKVCEQDVWLLPDNESESEFHCPNCNTYYCIEDGVMDWVAAYDFYLSYKGAKSAGLIKEPDVPRETYHSEWRD